MRGRLRPRHRAVRASLWVVAGSLVLASCDSNFGARDEATKQGGEIVDLWRVMVVIALVILALVVGLVAWCLVRYRAKGRTGDPNQRQYAVPIEVLYTTVPILIVAVLFALSWRTQDSVDALDAKPAAVIDVLGFQWQWRFEYRGDDVTVTGLPGRPPTMVLPVGETVRLHLDSRDVIHSFYVPHFLYKRDAIPGVKNVIDVDVTDAGTYKGYCAEFCGLDHARMTFHVRAVSPKEFRAWLDEHAGERLRGSET